MFVKTTCETTGPDDGDVVVPAGTAGQVIGSGYKQDGVWYIAVDFGNVACDVPLADIEEVKSYTVRFTRERHGYSRARHAESAEAAAAQVTAKYPDATVTSVVQWPRECPYCAPDEPCAMHVVDSDHKRMADALTEAVAAGDEDAMLKAESEILAELGVSRDDTEQGLTERAVFAVEDFVTKSTGTDWTYDGSAK